MNRIMVLGISAGVGKSTFSKRLGKALNIPVYHLDRYYWKPGWIEATLEEFAADQKEIVVHNQWIIEGNYSNTYDIRAERADTIIYLELPLIVCLYRVLKRWLTHIGKTRPDIGCTERMEWSFLKFIWTTYHPRKEKMEKRFEMFLSMGPDKKVIQLKSKKEIKQYLEKVVDS